MASILLERNEVFMTAALILAAGDVSGDDKFGPMDIIGEVSSIKRVILVYKQSGIKKIVVVTGYGAEALERHCSHLGVVFLRNDDYESSDMLKSAKIGLTYLADKCSSAFISPADIPLFSAETVKSMVNKQGSVIIPMHNNKTGHPLLLSRNLFEKVIEYKGTDGLEGALSGGDVERVFFDVQDVGIVTHVQGGMDLSGIIEAHSLRSIRAENKIMLTGEKGFFGPGAMHLLTLTNETGSLRQAAQQMGVSYSKAWKMITDIEDQLGVSILKSKAGGQKGGGSELTESGHELMRRYEMLEIESADYVQRSFERIFATPLYPKPEQNQCTE